MEIKTIGITTPGKREDDHGALEHINYIVTKGNGRYQVTWPWKNEDNELLENYELSFGRLKSLCKRIPKNPEV